MNRIDPKKFINVIVVTKVFLNLAVCKRRMDRKSFSTNVRLISKTGTSNAWTSSANLS